MFPPIVIDVRPLVATLYVPAALVNELGALAEVFVPGQGKSAAAVGGKHTDARFGHT